MGRIVFVVYKPRKGKESELIDLLREHLPILRSEGLVTDRKAMAMRTTENNIIEVFEWKSKEAIDRAHVSEPVRELWMRFDKVCTFLKPVDIKAMHQIFPDFEAIDIE